jgi:hypothetical protein
MRSYPRFKDKNALAFSEATEKQHRARGTEYHVCVYRTLGEQLAQIEYVEYEAGR